MTLLWIAGCVGWVAVVAHEIRFMSAPLHREVDPPGPDPTPDP